MARRAERGPEMSEQLFFSQEELAQRWLISKRTLERWRWLGTGPRYHKIGGRVIYKRDDIEAFEDMRSMPASQSTLQGGGA